MPISTHGVPPMRSSVENMKPWSLPSILAVVASTQSSFAFEIAPISNAPSIEPISSRSPSVSALASLVTTETAMSPLLDRKRLASILPPKSSAFTVGRRYHRRQTAAPRGVAPGSEHDGLVAERHSELAHGAVDVDPEVVGEAQHLAAPQIDQNSRITRVIAQDPLEALDAELVQ